ncbi:hypothetical protein O0L34_g5951 [Tuta absoluta]|nr:hypothetical protein O0L34_g5951 [Tuta absoluta]
MLSKVFLDKSYVCIIVVICLYILKAKCGRVKRVVGGAEVECGTQPRIASLRNSTTDGHLCVATVLSKEFALTAAHCVQYKPEQYVLQLNNLCAEGTPPRADVLEIIAHHLYDRSSRAHDIAILRIQLSTDDITWLGETVLPNSSFGISGVCTIYGYGSRKPDTTETSDVLMGANVTISSLDYCTEALGPIAPQYDAGQLCALGEGTDCCQGDSGGPLVCNSYIEGISSYGLSCGVQGMPGVYTSIGAHLKWIRRVLGLSRF